MNGSLRNKHTVLLTGNRISAVGPTDQVRTRGNVGIAAHRDGFFRVLKDIKEGDALILDTPVATERYRVEWIRVTTPDDVA